MMQELFGTPTLIGGGGGGGGERKIVPINGGIILEGTPPPPPLPSSLIPPSSSVVSVTTQASLVVPGSVASVANGPPTTNGSNNSSSSSSSSENQNLRCPRCDSSNTKFCYYNNYNLTQPRHFCKTCRRYWTKGGALRNVPIGGGCRKNKNSSSSAAIGITSLSSKSGSSKFKTLVSELGRPGLATGFDHEIIMPPNPVFWATGPHNSHILALLKSNQNPNGSPNPGTPTLPGFFPIKEEINLIGSHLMPEPGISSHASLNGRSLGMDPLGHCHYHHQQQNCVTFVGEAQNNGIQSLYQRLRASTGNNYYPASNTDCITPGIQCNMGTTATSTTISPASSSSPILESVPAVTSELGYWNPAFSMSDLPSTNGAAYP